MSAGKHVPCRTRGCAELHKTKFSSGEELPVLEASWGPCDYQIPNCSPKIANEFLSSSEPETSPRKKYFLLPEPPVFWATQAWERAPGGGAFGRLKMWAVVPFLDPVPSATQTHTHFGEIFLSLLLDHLLNFPSNPSSSTLPYTSHDSSKVM